MARILLLILALSALIGQITATPFGTMIVVVAAAGITAAALTIVGGILVDAVRYHAQLA